MLDSASSGLLGRTNRAFPLRWLDLVPGDDPARTAAAAAASGLPLHVARQPALWGGYLRGRDDLFLTMTSDLLYERATESTHAMDLTQAHLIQSLSSIGREWVDVYWFRARKPVEEFQIAGVLEVLESARQDSHIRHLGLWAEGPAYGMLSLWQFHDAFELICLPNDNESQEVLVPLAGERRVGVVYRDGAQVPGSPSYHPVRSAAEIDALGGPR